MWWGVRTGFASFAGHDRHRCALPAQLRHLIESDPAAARQAIDGLLLELHSLTTTATRTARKTGVNLEQVGRALRRVGEAVVLLYEAADLMLGALADTGRTRT